MSVMARSTVRITMVAIRSMLLFTAVLGVAYTFAFTGVAQLAFPYQANGSPVTNADGQTVGSALIGQPFLDADGNPDPRYFQPRPSAAGDNGYDGGASSGSNAGPENPDLVAAIAERQEQIAAFEGVDVAQIPADAVTASSSGLDPAISPAYARLQATRVARERNLPLDTVEDLIRNNTSGAFLGYFGDPAVNVLTLNTALDELEG